MSIKVRVGVGIRVGVEVRRRVTVGIGGPDLSKGFVLERDYLFL